ncbi:Uncharacterised protein [Mycobacteroides abscessus subsp. bolletii]|nr:Uncharacterised protein [Mycobacteroides abscessus subsp. bolletii]SHS47697.1 Uncharacterised protein [Mycobacteroides abscessus subsp. bolletii]SHT07205.1 Uncharacterised protein [Mycobacteroides abscessus subsp. bolletii]SHT14813.1 Uncharacterised protein [Mycobacteroides abscessus subsp. bolletii]SHY50522.1 Uncharacterised protein [Mycobacteroides abscessus subsp. bolletii]
MGRFEGSIQLWNFDQIAGSIAFAGSRAHHGLMKRVDYLDGWFLEVDSDAFRIESPAGSLTLSREELDELLSEAS